MRLTFFANFVNLNFTDLAYHLLSIVVLSIVVAYFIVFMKLAGINLNVLDYKSYLKS